MDIKNISNLRVEQDGNHWTFWVDYTVTFRNDEIAAGFTFADNARLVEVDPSDDDVIGGWIGERNWVPTTNEERRSRGISAGGDSLDTEWGGEEIAFDIGVRNLTTGATGVIRRSPNIQISPG